MLTPFIHVVNGGAIIVARIGPVKKHRVDELGAGKCSEILLHVHYTNIHVQLPFARAL